LDYVPRIQQVDGIVSISSVMPWN